MKTKIQTSVGVQLSIEGVHQFPNASSLCQSDKITFLEYTHRHNFNITCCIDVNDVNRQYEFILLKREVKKYLVHKYWSKELECCDFGDMSCESIAVDLIQAFPFNYVKVGEDGENFAEAFLSTEEKCCESCCSSQSETSPKEVTFYIGKVCSGKTYQSSIDFELMKKEGKNVCSLEIGGIVRLLTNTEARVYDAELVDGIVQKVKELTNHKSCILIVGCRQLSLFKKLYFDFFKDWNKRIVLTTVPDSVRKERFQKRQSHKDKGLTFEQVDQKDQELGIDTLISYIVNNNIQ